jgi:uncharacterized protein YifE (UPF0438 family)
LILTIGEHEFLFFGYPKIGTRQSLEKVHDVEFDKTNGFQDENEIFDDVRGIQLLNAMKNMDVGELRPTKINDEEDDQVQVLSNSNMQDDTNQESSSFLMTMCNINKWLVHHLNPMIKQVQAIKFQYSNQPILQGIIHWTL